MKNLSNYIETIGSLKEGDNSAAARGFDTAFLAWLCAPENLDRGKILNFALFSAVGTAAGKLSAATGNRSLDNICRTDAPEAGFVRFIRQEENSKAYPEASLYIDKHGKEIFRILKKIHNLKRSGWLSCGVSHPESVAEHSFSLALSVLLLTPENLNRDKSVAMALLHDLQEIHTGDFMPHDNISPEEKGRLELNAAKKIAKALHKPEISELFVEYEKSVTPESRLVKDLDRLDAVLLAAYYDRHRRAPYLLLPEFCPMPKKNTSAAMAATLSRTYTTDSKTKMAAGLVQIANRCCRFRPFLLLTKKRTFRRNHHEEKHRPLYSGRCHLPAAGGFCLSCSGAQTPFPQSLRHSAKPLYPSFGSCLRISVHKCQKLLADYCRLRRCGGSDNPVCRHRTRSRAVHHSRPRSGFCCRRLSAESG